MIIPSHRIVNFHYAIRHLVRTAEAQERLGRPVTYLNIGDPQVYGFRPPAHVVEAVVRAMEDRFTGYAPSAGLPEARAAVATYASNLGAPTSPDEVVITAGASEAADLVLTALLNEGDEVLLPAPGYPLYTAILSKLGCVTRYYQLDGSNGWQPSPDQVSSLINNRTRALVLINPNNPTGSITTDETTQQLLALALRHNLLVIADEVYRELCFERQPAASSVLAEEMAVPLITLESLSKTHIVPGWRTGWMRFTRAEKMSELISAIHRLASGRLCSPTPPQYGVRPALEGGQGFQQEFTREIKMRRDFAVARVRQIDRLSCDIPAAAFYMMIKVADLGEQTDESFVLSLLQETGILVVHGSGFGADPQQGYFRMVYLPGEELLAQVFSKLAAFLAEH